MSRKMGGQEQRALLLQSTRVGKQSGFTAGQNRWLKSRSMTKKALLFAACRVSFPYRQNQI
jgi:hypothetical protein